MSSNGYRKNFSAIHTVVGPETAIKGEINSQESIRIEGVFEGIIRAQGEIFVGEGATVKAQIFGRRVVVAGEVTGNVEAINGLEITGTSRVYGDVIGDRLIIDEGAVYKGNVKMDIVTSKKAYEDELKAKIGK